MSNTKAKPKHVHKLKKHTYKTGQEIFHCILPDCTFKMETALCEGKEAICNLCGDVFVLNVSHLRRKLPHCYKCGRVRVKTTDGKTHYVNKATIGHEVVREMAADTTSDLRARLDSLIHPEPDEDI